MDSNGVCNREKIVTSEREREKEREVARNGADITFVHRL